MPHIRLQRNVPRTHQGEPISTAASATARQRRTDIEGLRALSIILVFAYHLFPKTVTGGFIGVDVFFVISGYLITAHLLDEQVRTGRIRPLAFYGRRARRLLPASFLVLAVSLLVTALVMPAEQLASYPGDIRAAALYAVNWVLAGSAGGYAHIGDAPSIAQQYWSLSVEEQFYLSWPLLMLAVHGAATRLAGRRPGARAVFGITLTAVVVLSFAASVIQTERDQARAYFSTATRAWEFAAGGLLALAPAVRIGTRLRRGVLDSLAWAALIGLLGAAEHINDRMTFPGKVAVWPVVCVMVLLHIGDTGTPFTPARMSRRGPLVILGGISYAVYLWHWPVIVTFARLEGRVPGHRDGVVLVLVTLALAFATKVLVEDPLRFGTLLSSTRRSLLFAGIGSLCLAVASTGVASWSAMKADRLRDAHAPFASAAAVRAAIDATLAGDSWPGLSRFSGRERSAVWRVDDCLNVVDDRALARCTYGSPAATRTVAVIGDSFAASFMPGIVDGFTARDWRVVPLTLEQCPAVDVAVTTWTARTVEFAECARHRAWVKRELATLRPDLVIAVNAFASSERRFLSRARGDAALDEWATGLRSFLDGVVAQTPSLVVLSASPHPTCRVSSPPRECAPRAADPRIVAVESRAAAAVGARYVDVRPWFCTADLQICPEFIDGTYVYPSGDDHVTDGYARRLADVLYDATVTPAG